MTKGGARRPLRVTRGQAFVGLAFVVAGSAALVFLLRGGSPAPSSLPSPASDSSLAVPTPPSAGEQLPGGPSPSVAASPDGAVASPGLTEGPSRTVTLFWPGADGRTLVPLAATISADPSLLHQAKQVVSLLLAGPIDEGVAAPFPPGVTLRAVFLDRRAGTAWVSLSSEAVTRATGGSDGELLAVYSIVNSLTDSLPEVRRVQILVEGEEVETLAGHLDLTEPLLRNAGLVSPPG